MQPWGICVGHFDHDDDMSETASVNAAYVDSVSAGFKSIRFFYSTQKRPVSYEANVRYALNAGLTVNVCLFANAANTKSAEDFVRHWRGIALMRARSSGPTWLSSLASVTSTSQSCSMSAGSGSRVWGVFSNATAATSGSAFNRDAPRCLDAHCCSSTVPSLSIALCSVAAEQPIRLAILSYEVKRFPFNRICSALSRSSATSSHRGPRLGGHHHHHHHRPPRPVPSPWAGAAAWCLGTAQSRPHRRPGVALVGGAPCVSLITASSSWACLIKRGCM